MRRRQTHAKAVKRAGQLQSHLDHADRMSALRPFRACLKNGWHGLPARFRRQLAAETCGRLVACRHRPVACSTQNLISKQALREYTLKFIPVPVPADKAIRKPIAVNAG